MAFVDVLNVNVLDNPSSFLNPLQFEITFEVAQPLTDDLEWKIVYVGSAIDSTLDQELEDVMVGPVSVGINKFVLQTPAPDPSKIPNEDLVGVTVVLLSCSYLDSQFIQIGYYINNEYTEEYDPESPPISFDITKIRRIVLADEPRVTRCNINWSGSGEIMPPPPGEGVGEEQEEELKDEGEEMEEDDEDDEEDGDEEGEIDLEAEEMEGEEEEDGEGEEEDDEDGATDGNQSTEEERTSPSHFSHSLAPSSHSLLINEESMDVGMMQTMAAHSLSNP